jgi:DNA-binding HxlR family transcriptional regulator
MSSLTEPVPGILRPVLGKDYERQDCSVARALEVVGERWTLLIVRDALFGVRRFNDFQVHLDIPKAVLADRLNGLVERGILVRTPDPDHAGRHLYELTAAGRGLWPVVYSLLIWGSSHRARSGRVFTHADCGTPLDRHGACPECAVTPEPGDVTITPREGRRTFRDDPVTVALRGPHRLLEPVRV